MLKAKAQETISPFKPLHLLQPNIQKKQVLIFCTNSEHSFWMKENQSAWEEVTINPDGYFCDRDGGSATFKFNGKEFNELFVSSPLQPVETSYISGDRQHIKLEKLPLSKEKLEEIGITNQVKLDLFSIPESIADAEKIQKEKLAKRNASTSENLSRLLKKDLNLFFNALSDSGKFSEPGTSSSGEKLTKGLSN